MGWSAEEFEAQYHHLHPFNERMQFRGYHDGRTGDEDVLWSLPEAVELASSRSS